MIKDALLVLQALVTKTADFNGASIDLVTGTALRGLGIQLIVTTAPDQVTGDETYQFKLQESDDDAAWRDLLSFTFKDSAAETLAAYEEYQKFSTNSQFVRLILDVAGTTPSITYKAFIVPDRPV